MRKFEENDICASVYTQPAIFFISLLLLVSLSLFISL